MRDLSEKLVRREIPWLILVSVILSFTFGVMLMQIDKDGNMSVCPFINEASLCRMSIFEHISTFQALFVLISTSRIISILLTTITLLVLSLFAFARHWPELLTEKVKIQSDYSKQNFYLPLLFKPIRKALSRGIIQPKIYELATMFCMFFLPNLNKYDSKNPYYNYSFSDYHSFGLSSRQAYI